MIPDGPLLGLQPDAVAERERIKKPHGSVARPGGRGEYVVVRIVNEVGKEEHLGGV